jgi:tetratricopeptide (TPR) repeat protein
VQKTELILQSPVLVILLVLGTIAVIAAVLLRSPKEKGILGKEYKIPAGMLPEGQDQNLGFMEHLNRGNEALAQYDFDQALLHFQEAVKLKNSDPSVHFKIGRIFLQKDDTKNAIVAFRNVLNLNPSQIEAHFELARAYQAQKNLELAHQELGQALSINPEHEETLKFKVKLYEQEEKYPHALPIVKKLVGLSRQPMKYRAKAADYLTRMGKFEEAVAEYESLVDLDPDNRFQYKGKIGQAYFEMGNYTKAIEFFKQVLQDHGPNLVEASYIAILKSQMAAALCNEGVRFFEVEDYAAAIQRYQEALMHDDANVDIHYNLGKAYTRTRDTLNALKHFERGISLNPMDVSCYYELAVLQDEKGMIPEATANYRKVLELDPANANATFGLGTLYGVQGHLEESIRYLSDAIRLNPQFIDAIYNLGVALERKKDFNKAIQMYRKVLSLDKDHEKSRSNLAHITHVQSQSH